MSIKEEQTAALANLIACPTCDSLYQNVEPQFQERAVCPRCHTVLSAPIKGSVARIVALAIAVVVFLIAAVFLPFLRIEANGFQNASSIFDAAFSFSAAHLVVLSIAVLILILFIPMARAALLIFALSPLLLQRPPFRGAYLAFRWSEDLRPWSMAEIFVLGVGVALVKIVDLARVEVGAAFWLFSILVVFNVFQDTLLCRSSVWRALDRARNGLQND